MRSQIKGLLVVIYILAVGIFGGLVAKLIGHQPFGIVVVSGVSVFIHIFSVNAAESWFFSDIGDMTDRLHPIGARTWIMGVCCTLLVVVTIIIQLVILSVLR